MPTSQEIAAGLGPVRNATTEKLVPPPEALAEIANRFIADNPAA